MDKHGYLVLNWLELAKLEKIKLLKLYLVKHDYLKIKLGYI
jgi:hypothetical protein